jgi:hypothetical protein
LGCVVLPKSKIKKTSTQNQWWISPVLIGKSVVPL